MDPRKLSCFSARRLVRREVMPLWAIEPIWDCFSLWNGCWRSGNGRELGTSGVGGTDLQTGGETELGVQGWCIASHQGDCGRGRVPVLLGSRGQSLILCGGEAHNLVIVSHLGRLMEAGADGGVEVSTPGGANRFF